MPNITITEKDQAMLTLLSARQAGAVIHRLFGREAKLDNKAEAVYTTIKGGLDKREEAKKRKRKSRDCHSDRHKNVTVTVTGQSQECHSDTPPFLPPSPFSPTPPLSSPPYNPPTPPPTARDEGLGKVISLFLDRVNPAPSPICMDELKNYTQILSHPVVEKVICEAIDQGKASWPYIHKVLQGKQQRGITSLAAWDKWENERERRKQHGTVTGNSPNENGKNADAKWGVRSALSVGD